MFAQSNHPIYGRDGLIAGWIDVGDGDINGYRMSLMLRSYRWRHIPSKSEGRGRGLFLDRMSYLAAIAKWNAQSDDWVYSATPEGLA